MAGRKKGTGKKAAPAVATNQGAEMKGNTYWERPPTKRTAGKRKLENAEENNKVEKKRREDEKEVDEGDEADKNKDKADEDDDDDDDAGGDEADKNKGKANEDDDDDEDAGKEVDEGDEDGENEAGEKEGETDEDDEENEEGEKEDKTDEDYENGDAGGDRCGSKRVDVGGDADGDDEGEAESVDKPDLDFENEDIKKCLPANINFVVRCCKESCGKQLLYGGKSVRCCTLTQEEIKEFVLECHQRLPHGLHCGGWNAKSLLQEAPQDLSSQWESKREKSMKNGGRAGKINLKFRREKKIKKQLFVVEPGGRGFASFIASNKAKTAMYLSKLRKHWALHHRNEQLPEELYFDRIKHFEEALQIWNSSHPEAADTILEESFKRKYKGDCDTELLERGTQYILEKNQYLELWNEIFQNYLQKGRGEPENQG